jgi:alpha-tubulin suppressor-like RCC1 family protein
VAIKTDGTLWAWGYNSTGQLGDGTTISRYSPIRIGTDTNWTSVSAGNEYTVAIRTNDTLWAWGRKTSLEAANFFRHNVVNYGITPARVVTPSGLTFVSVSAGANHSIIVGRDGILWAWGENGNWRDNYGKLGDGTTYERSAPIRVIQ